MAVLRRTVRGALAALCAVCAVAGCTGPGAAVPRTAALQPRTATAEPTAPTSRTLTSPTPTETTPTETTPTETTPAAPLSGGNRILGRYRVVAYYGAPAAPGLGVLGSGPPDLMAARIATRAKAFARFGRPVLPAMELIATVAQAGPGRDGTYSKPIPNAAIARYLAAAHRHHLLLILDFQPGRAEFLPQVQAVAPFLSDPSVSVALDPEWKMAPGQIPGRVVGSASAASVNAVAGYLAGIVARRHLPDKLLLVHQFRPAMLPDRGRIAPARGIEVVFHADGFGTQPAKLATWRKLAFPGRPFGTGLKLFLRQDVGLMTPATAMAVKPTPDVITYQ